MIDLTASLNSCRDTILNAVGQVMPYFLALTAIFVGIKVVKKLINEVTK